MVTGWGGGGVRRWRWASHKLARHHSLEAGEEIHIHGIGGAKRFTSGGADSMRCRHVGAFHILDGIDCASSGVAQVVEPAWYVL